MTLRTKFKRIITSAASRLNDSHSLLSIAEGEMEDINIDEILSSMENAIMSYIIQPDEFDKDSMTIYKFIDEHVLYKISLTDERKQLLVRAIVSAMDLVLDTRGYMDKLIKEYTADSVYMHNIVNTQVDIKLAKLKCEDDDISLYSIRSLMNISHEISMELSINFKDIYFYISSILTSSDYDSNLNEIQIYISEISSGLTSNRQGVAKYLYTRIKHEIDDMLDIHNSITMNIKSSIVSILMSSAVYTVECEVVLANLANAYQIRPLVFYSQL